MKIDIVLSGLSRGFSLSSQWSPKRGSTVQRNPSYESISFAHEKWPVKRGGFSSGVEINTLMFRFTWSKGVPLYYLLFSLIKEGYIVCTWFAVIFSLFSPVIFMLSKAIIWNKIIAPIRANTNLFYFYPSSDIPIFWFTFGWDTRLRSLLYNFSIMYNYHFCFHESFLGAKNLLLSVYCGRAISTTYPVMKSREWRYIGQRFK